MLREKLLRQIQFLHCPLAQMLSEPSLERTVAISPSHCHDGNSHCRDLQDHLTQCQIPQSLVDAQEIVGIVDPWKRFVWYRDVKKFAQRVPALLDFVLEQPILWGSRSDHLVMIEESLASGPVGGEVGEGAEGSWLQKEVVSYISFRLSGARR